MPYLYGVVADILRENLIDLDECGVFVKTANKYIEKSYVGIESDRLTITVILKNRRYYLMWFGM